MEFKIVVVKFIEDFGKEKKEVKDWRDRDKRSRRKKAENLLKSFRRRII